jgi:NTE family protein
LDERQINTRRYHIGKLLKKYQDTDAHPFIHLLDGGISDNLGIRPVISGVNKEKDIWKRLKKLDLEKTRKLVIIVVNAQPAIDTEFAKRDYSIPILDSIGASSSIPLDQYSYETMELLRGNMSRWREEISAGLCGEDPSPKGRKHRDNPAVTPACDAQTYLIDVDFDRLKDESESEHLKRLPTSFRLEAGDVDRLKAAARTILTESAEFKKLIEDMQ